MPKAQPQTAADIPGETMNSTNGVTPRAWKMIGVHQTMDNAVPAAPNPRAAQMRGDPLKTVATSGIDKGPQRNLVTLRTSPARQIAARPQASQPPPTQRNGLSTGLRRRLAGIRTGEGSLNTLSGLLWKPLRELVVLPAGLSYKGLARLG